MFKVLGIALACYVGYAIYAGEVYGKSGASGRSWSRDEEPARFWSVVAAYCLLTAALIFVF